MDGDLHCFKIIFESSWMSTKMSVPNPDIEKVDVTSHEDLERFFLNKESLILQLISLFRIRKENPSGAWPFLSFLAIYSLGFLFCPLDSFLFSPVWP